MMGQLFALVRQCHSVARTGGVALAGSPITEVRLLFPRGFLPAPLSRRRTLSEGLRVEG